MTDLTLEQAMGRLDEIVAVLESGESTLDDSLAFYSEGAALLARCEKILTDARIKVENLVTDK